MIYWLYLALGVWTAFRLVPWGARSFYVGRSRIVGAVAVGGLVVAAWPIYFYAWWRSAALEQLRDRDRAEALLDALEDLDDGTSVD